MGDSKAPLWGRVADNVASLTPETPYRTQEDKPRLLIVGAGMMGREHLRVTLPLKIEKIHASAAAGINLFRA